MTTTSTEIVDTINRFLDLGRTLERVTRELSSLPADPADKDGNKPFTEQTLTDLWTQFSRAQEACALVVGTYVQVAGIVVPSPAQPAAVSRRP